MLTEKAKEARRNYYRSYYARMTPEQKKRKGEQIKEWRKKNPEKNKAIIIRYWIKKAKEMEAQGNE